VSDIAHYLVPDELEMSERVIRSKQIRTIFKILTDNIAINSFTNVKRVPKAVSNPTGQTKFYKKQVSHPLYNHVVLPTRASTTVDTTALDDFVCDCPEAVRNRISLIKIDIEGAES
jgi:FkbM family methyltransferase